MLAKAIQVLVSCQMGVKHIQHVSIGVDCVNPSMLELNPSE
jgi:hypothetical protein